MRSSDFAISRLETLSKENKALNNEFFQVPNPVTKTCLSTDAAVGPFIGLQLGPNAGKGPAN